MNIRLICVTEKICFIYKYPNQKAAKNIVPCRLNSSSVIQGTGHELFAMPALQELHLQNEELPRCNKSLQALRLH